MTTMGPLHLYRSLLRHANGMKDYNFRMYAQRRVKAGFQKNRNLQGYVGLFVCLVCLFVCLVCLLVGLLLVGCVFLCICVWTELTKTDFFWKGKKMGLLFSLFFVVVGNRAYLRVVLAIVFCSFVLFLLLHTYNVCVCVYCRRLGVCVYLCVCVYTSLIFCVFIIIIIIKERSNSSHCYWTRTIRHTSTSSNFKSIISIGKIRHGMILF